jgi:hypothetical protein
VSKGFLHHIKLYVSNLRGELIFWLVFGRAAMSHFRSGKAGRNGDWVRCTWFLHETRFLDIPS